MKTDFVDDIFSDVSHRYDLMNDLMSIGLHRYWKKRLVSYLTDPQAKLIDVATGTGDIALAFYRQAMPACMPDIVICDPNAKMLSVAKARFVNSNFIRGIYYENCRAEDLPFASNTFDCYTISFGMRNVQSIKKALSEAHRILKPGGRFFCLEFSQVNIPIIKELYSAYSSLIPKLGKVVTNNAAAYQYLIDSIKAFPNRFMLSKMMIEAGFKTVNFTTLAFGVVAIHIGYKSA